MKKKRSWLGRLTIWSLRWIIIIGLSVVRIISLTTYRVSNWMLLKLGIDWSTHRESMAGQTLKLVKGGKEQPEWQQVGRKKDGMILQKNTRTGQERVVTEREGKVISYL
jgi:hypothetical protein